MSSCHEGLADWTNRKVLEASLLADNQLPARRAMSSAPPPNAQHGGPAVLLEKERDVLGPGSAPVAAEGPAASLAHSSSHFFGGAFAPADNPKTQTIKYPSQKIPTKAFISPVPANTETPSWFDSANDGAGAGADDLFASFATENGAGGGGGKEDSAWSFVDSVQPAHWHAAPPAAPPETAERRLLNSSSSKSTTPCVSPNLLGSMHGAGPALVHCSRCSKPNDPRALFCNRCGLQFVQVPAVLVPPSHKHQSLDVDTAPRYPQQQNYPATLPVRAGEEATESSVSERHSQTASSFTVQPSLTPSLPLPPAIGISPAIFTPLVSHAFPSDSHSHSHSHPHFLSHPHSYSHHPPSLYPALAKNEPLPARPAVAQSPTLRIYPVFCFGMGGSAFASFPMKQMRFGGLSSAHMSTATAHYRPSAMYKVEIATLPGIRERLVSPILSSLGGVPISEKHVKPRELVALLEGWIGSGSPSQEKQRTLLKLLVVMLSHKGGISGAGEEEVQKILLSDSPPERSSVFSPVASPASELPSPGITGELTKLLIQGDRENAVLLAASHQLWAHALLIASHVDRETYFSTVSEFAKHSLPIGHPLRSMYLLFAGQGALAGAEMQQTGSALRTSWAWSLAMILANRTSGDHAAIIGLGDALLRIGEVFPAHVCYLLSNDAGLLSGVDSEHGRIVLLGTAHTEHPNTFYRDFNGLRLTEILEFSLRQASGGQYCMAHLQAYKLIHASLLADLGLGGLALKYCESLSALIKTFPASSAYINETFMVQLKQLEGRLAHCFGGIAAGAPGSDGGWYTKMPLGGLLQAFDRGLTRVIGVSTVEETGVGVGVAVASSEAKGADVGSSNIFVEPQAPKAALDTQSSDFYSQAEPSQPWQPQTSGSVQAFESQKSPQPAPTYPQPALPDFGRPPQVEPQLELNYASSQFSYAGNSAPDHHGYASGAIAVQSGAESGSYPAPQAFIQHAQHPYQQDQQQSQKYQQYQQQPHDGFAHPDAGMVHSPNFLADESNFEQKILVDQPSTAHLQGEQQINHVFATHHHQVPSAGSGQAPGFSFEQSHVFMAAPPVPTQDQPIASLPPPLFNTGSQPAAGPSQGFDSLQPLPAQNLEGHYQEPWSQAPEASAPPLAVLENHSASLPAPQQNYQFPPASRHNTTPTSQGVGYTPTPAGQSHPSAGSPVKTEVFGQPPTHPQHAQPFIHAPAIEFSPDPVAMPVKSAAPGEEDDLGFGNLSLSRQKISTKGPDGAPDSQNETGKVAAAVAREKEKEAEKGEKPGVLKFFSGWFGSKKSPESSGAKQANLGEPNTFHYDEKLKRWVSLNDPETSSAPADLPPPPAVFSSAGTLPLAPQSPDGSPANFRRGAVRSARSKYIDPFNSGAEHGGGEEAAAPQIAVPALPLPTIVGGAPASLVPQPPAHFAASTGVDAAYSPYGGQAAPTTEQPCAAEMGSAQQVPWTTHSTVAAPQTQSYQYQETYGPTAF